MAVATTKLPSGMPSSVANQYLNSTAGGSYKPASTTTTLPKNTSPYSNQSSKVDPFNINSIVNAVNQGQTNTSNTTPKTYTQPTNYSQQLAINKFDGYTPSSLENVKAKENVVNPQTDYYDPTGGYGGSGGGYSDGGSSGGDSTDAYAKYLQEMKALEDARWKAEQDIINLKKEQTKKTNDDNLRRIMGLLYNQSNLTNDMIERQLGTGLSGAMITQRIANGLNRANNVYNAFKDRDEANANNELSSNEAYINGITKRYNNMSNLVNSVNNINDDETKRRLSEIIRNVF